MRIIKGKWLVFDTSAEYFAFEKQEEEKKDEAKVTDLKLVRTGSDVTPPSGNWLKDLKVGTVFTVMSKMDRSNFMVLTLEILRKTDKTVRLWDAVNDKFFGDVIPQRFINFFDLVEIIEVPTEEEKTSTNDGSSDRVQGNDDISS